MAEVLFTNLTAQLLEEPGKGILDAKRQERLRSALDGLYISGTLNHKMSVEEGTNALSEIEKDIKELLAHLGRNGTPL